jgi:hypothetical protein
MSLVAVSESNRHKRHRPTASSIHHEPMMKIIHNAMKLIVEQNNSGQSEY